MGFFNIFEDSETVTYDNQNKTIESSGNPSNESKSSFFTSPLAFATYAFVILGSAGGYIYYKRRKAKQNGL